MHTYTETHTPPHPCRWVKQVMVECVWECGKGSPICQKLCPQTFFILSKEHICNIPRRNLREETSLCKRQSQKSVFSVSPSAGTPCYVSTSTSRLNLQWWPCRSQSERRRRKPEGRGEEPRRRCVWRLNAGTSSPMKTLLWASCWWTTPWSAWHPFPATSAITLWFPQTLAPRTSPL